MNNKFFSLLLAMLGTCSCLSAQSQVLLSVPDVIATGEEDIVCVPVIADSFPNIIAVQFSLAWDETEVEFVEARLGDNPLDLSGMATSMPQPNNFWVAFIPADFMGITLEPHTVMFELCFNTRNMSGSTPISFNGTLPPEFGQAGPVITAFPFDTISGSISYGSDVATTVLPGDTDDNQQVDHRDILNLGLLFGETGPARINAATDFASQASPVWPNNLANGINFAKVDANGDGTINDADQDLVDAYYSQEADGNFEFAPDVSTQTGPALALAFTEALDAGQEGTLVVSLGDGTDPNAVGYGLAFSLTFDPSRVDMSSITTDFSNAFLGNDLFVLDKVNPRTNGLVEIALSRKDGVNTTTPGGEVLRLTLTTIPATDNSDYTMEVTATPNAFLRADQSAGDITGSTLMADVIGNTSSNEPQWAQGISIYPNPYTSGPMFIRGDLPTIDRVLVLDIAGRQLRDYTGNVRELDLEGLPSGSYLLQIEAQGGRINRKVVKQ
ncbi:MAG: hypothetical protein ACJAZ9_001080 [Neolewinella sp.]|jgi:hypothetical protein